MKMNIADIEKYRYERKFVINSASSNVIELELKLHPALFSEIYEERIINNIYLDTLDFENYLDNLNGNSGRKKIRIRWYGDLFGEINNPVLEIKRKHGSLGSKDIYKLKMFTFNMNFKLNTIKNIFLMSDIPENLLLELKSIYPKLLNQYKRKYFLSQDKKIRVTLDKNMRYYNIQNMHEYKEDNIVLEIKYNYEDDKRFNRIPDYLKYRITKNSKYINGIDFLNFSRVR
jgi:SPX domain protein involved in polyphosphate accumulation